MKPLTFDGPVDVRRPNIGRVFLGWVNFGAFLLALGGLWPLAHRWQLLVPVLVTGAIGICAAVVLDDNRTPGGLLKFKYERYVAFALLIASAVSVGLLAWAVALTVQ